MTVRRIGAYEVLAELGRGGAGVVFRARGAGESIVAIKVLLQQDPEGVARFEREARLQSMLGEEAGFVPLLGAGVERGAPFIVTPFLEGGSLRDRLKKGPLGVAETHDLGVRLAGAMGRAHAAGVVHRDLKPENVLFAKDGTAFVADLGLAKHLRADGAASRSVDLSRTGALYGTAGYMPNEQMDDRRQAGAPADVFALGAILYECLAGRPAFVGEGFLDLVAKIGRGQLDPLAAARPDAPRALTAAIEKALAKDAAARFPDGAAFARALEGAKAGARPPRRTPAIVLGLAVPLLAAGAFAVTRTPQTPTPGPPPGPTPPVAPVASPTASPTSSRPVPGERSGPPWQFATKIRAVAFVAPKKVIVGCEDGDVAFVDLASGVKRRLAQLSEVRAFAVSTSGKHAVSAHKDGLVVGWDLAKGVTLWRDEATEEDIALGVAIFSNDELFATCGRLPTMRVATVSDNTVRAGFQAHGEKRAVGLAAPAHGRFIVSVGHDRAVRIWSFVDPERTGAIETAQKLSCVAVTPGGERVLVGTDPKKNGERGLVEEWDLATRKQLASFEAQASGVECVAYARGGTHALVGGADKHDRKRALLLIDLAARTESVLPDRAAMIHSCAVSPDGRRAVSGSDDTLRLWDLETCSEVSAP